MQYNAPLFVTLTKRENVVVKVFYTWDRESQGCFDRDFGIHIEWDRPLLDGYAHCFSKNTSETKMRIHDRRLLH